MAGELQTPWLSGRTVYFLVRSTSAQIWNGSALENYASANYVHYAIPGTPQGSSGYYVANMPPAPAGDYAIVALEQAGASPAELDSTVGAGQALRWNGSALVSADPLASTVSPGIYPSGSAGDKLSKLGTGAIEVVSPVTVGGDFTVWQGDTYHAADGRAIPWSGAGGAWPNLTGATSITLFVAGSGWTHAVEAVTTGTGAQQIQLELSDTDTEAMPRGERGFLIRAVLASGHKATLVSATVTVNVLSS